jgi:hypothetical protein
VVSAVAGGRERGRGRGRANGHVNGCVRGHEKPYSCRQVDQYGGLVWSGGRVFAVVDLRRVICGLQGCLAIVVQNATLEAVGSAANTTSSPSSFVSDRQYIHTVHLPPSAML